MKLLELKNSMSQEGFRTSDPGARGEHGGEADQHHRYALRFRGLGGRWRNGGLHLHPEFGRGQEVLGVAVEAARVTSRPGAGPRHIDFHPKKPFAYVINELDSTITTYRKSGPVLAPLQTTPSCPDTFTGYSTGAELWVGRDGRHVYVTNRGHDSIGVFAIDPSRGTLSPKQWVPTHGSVPRFFAFDRAERFLYVANQGGDTIFAYKVGHDGKLSPTRIKVAVGSPACIVFSRGASS